ncbi:anaerobic ribonucleoside-triphosphate reductase activating protein [Rhodomicrobium vannielii ATCC 17100]|uniref:anaerobic ribonucleoside-triphosphate reductase activating protein n=1 Tax=Rhodomicrobium vannielii TaxID=1069 RepID=UPI0019189920|nr:anaerobic ribonucleoside-triphosphate reductase activating protein [Rhodomicrobium vannielii]MBJ7535536.1 anaerobic ribonucleoside-triphosphate reductase activating protein [Rhodomicrobium vannielii ATCC 17100]
MQDSIEIGGFARLSSVDWPGQLAATVFCQGCPWACRYCHNTSLTRAGRGAGPSWAEVRAFLQTRRGLLDAVVFSGGEPTLQTHLPEAMAEVRAMGFRVGLHSAGPYPTRLAAVLPLVDWVGFDVKAPFAEYERITGVPGSGERAAESLRLLVASGVAFETRTTVHPALLDDAALARIAAELAALGIANNRIQPFRSLGCTDAALAA